MVTPVTIPVFLNGRPARVLPGATLRDLVSQEDPDLAQALEAGRARATDARGIAAPADIVLVAGTIYRVFLSARSERDAADA